MRVMALAVAAILLAGCGSREPGNQSAASAPPVDADDVGAQVGQQHAEERHRPDRRQFENSYAVERAGHPVTS